MSDETQPDAQESPKPDSQSQSAQIAKGGSGQASSRSTWRPLATAAVVGLVAGALGGMAVAGWWRPASGTAGKFSAQQVDDAKKDVCAAALLARQAVAKNMHLKNPDPENPIAQLAVAANARLSLTGGAAYLRGRLDEDTAAPREVIDAARAMAGALEHLNVSYLVGQPNTDHEQLGRELDSRITELGKLCD